jgi:TolA-binding protein
MRQGLVAMSLVLVGIIGCQSVARKTSLRVSPNKVKKSSITRRLPVVKEVEGPANVFKIHNELAGAIPQEATSLNGPVELSDKEKIYFELAGEKIENLKEIEIYQKTVEKYQQGDESAMNAYANLLLKRFPKSIYGDNVLYLQGMLSFSQKKYGESLSFFQRILSVYPQSNKAVSALFAKGVVFKKMNLNKESVRLLAEVINQYPGSPESDRAQAELKLIAQ